MFNLEKAKVLANICRATYESRPTFSEYAQSLSDSKLIKPTDESVPVRALSGFIDEELIIAFRGTVVANLNQETDIVLAMLACMFCNFTPILGISPEKFNSLIHEQEIKDIYGGEIHLGFALLMDKIWSQIQSVIEQSKPSKICLSGHSLGGALATLAAYRLRNQNVPISVYTFGAPRVGDRAFASRYEVSKIPHFRIENKNDIVPHLPPDYQTKSKIEFTTQSINTILNLFHDFGLPIPNELRNLQIPNFDYPPVGSLKFIDWNETIVKDSDSLIQERLFRLPKDILDIEKSHILFDHKIESYSQEFNRCRIEQTEEMFMQSSEFEKIVYNIVIIGRTGAGKSALINYLYGDTIAITGVGQPVTKEGFHKHNLTWKSIPINIYDSWGLEVGQSQKWLKMLNNELKEHGTDRPVSEWFHTIFYCINAASTRIEPFEFSIIQDLITNKYRVIVVLTRAELMSRESLGALKECIRKDVSSEIPIIEVCNVAQKILNTETKTFGKEELQNETLRGFWNGITIRLPERCEYVLHQEVDKWREQQEEYLNSTKRDFMSIFKQSEIKNTIDKNYMTFFIKLKDTRYEIIVGEVKKIVNYYKQLVEILDYPPPEDLPVFTLENEKLISDTFLEKIVGLLQQAEQSYFRLIGKFLNLILPDKRATLQLEITKFCNDLKKEITRQKPVISKIIERIRKDTL